MLEKKISMIMLIISSLIMTLCLVMTIGMHVYWLAVLIALALIVTIAIIYDERKHW